MTVPRDAEYGLRRYVRGVPGFAVVRVRVTGGGDRSEVVTAVDPDGGPSASPEQDPDWFAGAERGCREALALVGPQRAPLTVRITGVVGTLADSTPATMRAAGTMAVLTALGRAEEYEVVRDPDWRVRRRTSAGS
ncbi:hypothetical protein [Marinactinospora rubrisoli]|uniref:Uncharacterized protein n=1 Tax=Marinactinospora rubrisoli TaxID=2715399 RepID=A0ABW2KJG1_9ACTN